MFSRQCRNRGIVRFPTRHSERTNRLQSLTWGKLHVQPFGSVNLYFIVQERVLRLVLLSVYVTDTVSITLQVTTCTNTCYVKILHEIFSPFLLPASSKWVNTHASNYLPNLLLFHCGSVKILPQINLSFLLQVSFCIRNFVLCSILGNSFQSLRFFISKSKVAVWVCCYRLFSFSVVDTKPSSQPWCGIQNLREKGVFRKAILLGRSARVGTVWSQKNRKSHYTRWNVKP